MKRSHCFYTSFNRAYAAQALVLVDSLRQVYGDSAHIVALLVDEIDDDDRVYLASFNEILLARDLKIANFRSWLFGHNIVEAATAVKPFALLHLLARFSQVTYLDPDIFVYAPLDEVIGDGGRWDATITPHQITPQREEWVVEATELESLRYGVYNLGFLSVRSSAQGERLATWWSERCYNHCIIDIERGLFTDQKLFDLAPALFSGVRVLRHAGYNVATWNIRERRIHLGADGARVNNDLLRFCHFTKATHLGATALERMDNGDSLFQELFYGYVARLREKERELAALDKQWAYGVYENGENIEPSTRLAFRACRAGRWELGNPFSSKTAVTAHIAKLELAEIT